MRLLVTGASGFIGSAFLRYISRYRDYRVRAFARNTNQKHLMRIAECKPAFDSGKYHLVYGDLLGDISGLCEQIDAVIHFAAKTHVDHAIVDPEPFVSTNVIGTFRLLEDARRYKVKKFVTVSTDEVYGSILNGAYDENARLNPSNPYAAAKAGGDALTISYANTYGLHTAVTRCENNFGSWQHYQKAFPTFTRMAMMNQPLPVYGRGEHIRQWIHVDDHVKGILTLIENDIPPGSVYHIAGSQELMNIDLAKWILKCCNRSEDLIRFVPDHDIRPGHDRRYALKCDKLMNLGWKPEVSLEKGIPEVVEWYKVNSTWL